jgi:hypothetical protein
MSLNKDMHKTLNHAQIVKRLDLLNEGVGILLEIAIRSIDENSEIAAMYRCYERQAASTAMTRISI